MRWLNIIAALTGAAALMMLAAAHHLEQDSDFNNVLVAGLAQLSAAAAGLAIANRSGLLNEIAGALILLGGNLFACEIYFSSFRGEHTFAFLAPIGGALLIGGWVLLAFARPTARNGEQD
ncbi:MAG TPA: DUF423 domain-containing protein [Vitreimonas sp.]|jgi:uncharacterized membrane protein YgdD (TMEM256/DUF423 family)|nr:DUF423 domain-containing protein [Vitreimonas sp.]